MIGQILLIILRVLLYLLIILLALVFLLLLVPVGVYVTYDRGDLAVRVRYGPVKRQILPKAEDTEEEEEKAPKEEKPEEQTEKKRKLNTGQLLYSLEKLPPILGRALKRLGHGIWLDPLKVHILAAGPDPADTALLYGRLYAALSVAVPWAERLMRIQRQDVRLFVDFQEETPDLSADVGLHLRPMTAVGVLLLAGAGVLRWYLGFRKLAAPEMSGDGGTPGSGGTPRGGKTPENGGKDSNKTDGSSEKEAA